MGRIRDTVTVESNEGERQTLQTALEVEEKQNLHAFVRDKRFMIVGGAGSLGLEMLSYLHESNEMAVFLNKDALRKLLKTHKVFI